MDFTNKSLYCETHNANQTVNIVAMKWFRPTENQVALNSALAIPDDYFFLKWTHQNHP